VHRAGIFTTGCSHQIEIEPVGIEGSYGCHQLRHCNQTVVEGLVGRHLLLGHLTSPEPFTVQADIPVTEVVVYKIVDCPSSLGRLVVGIVLVNLLDQGVEERQDPPVDLGTPGQFDLGILVVEVVHICIEGKERVGVEEGSEKLAAGLLHTIYIKLQVIPGSGIGNHIPAQRVGTELFDGLERINRIPQPLRHLVAILVENQTVRNHVFEGDASLHHRTDGMKGKEPATSLVDPLGDEVGRIYLRELLFRNVRIEELRKGHRTAIEPDIDQVGLAIHRPAAFGNQHDLVHIGTVKVDLVVFQIAVLLQVKPFPGQFGHHPGIERLLHFVAELLHRTDALLLLPIFGAPDRKGCSPVTAAAQVPVLQVFQPLSETASAGGLRFPVDGFVQFDHLLTAGGRADEPAVERIVEHRLVGPPAVRVAVDHLLDAEGPVTELQGNGEIDIECGVVGRERRIIFIFHIPAGILPVKLHVEMILHEIGVQLLQEEVLSGEVYHRPDVALLVYHGEAGDIVLLPHPGVVGTKRGCDMDDAGSIIGGDEIAANHPECLVGHLHPGEKLFVTDAGQFRSPPALFEHPERDILIPLLILFELQLRVLRGEIGAEQIFGQHHGKGLAGILVVGLDGNILDIGTYGQQHVRGQCPRRGGPCQEEGFTELGPLGKRIGYLELCRTGGILNVAVATGLVQFVRAQSRSGRRRVWLNGIALVEIPLVVDLFQQIP
jgi:hypothetical protein